MWCGIAYQFFADTDGEGEVGEVVAMQVAEFALAEAELDAAEAVRRLDHTGPREDFIANLRACRHIP
jgi:hypothetical protein